MPQSRNKKFARRFAQQCRQEHVPHELGGRTVLSGAGAHLLLKGSPEKGYAP